MKVQMEPRMETEEGTSVQGPALQRALGKLRMANADEMGMPIDFVVKSRETHKRPPN